ncbi:MAG: tyrosine-type recombinase/integrase [Mariprofundales bacterium]
MEILDTQKKICAGRGAAAGTLVFPSLRPKRPMSDNTFNMALRAMGYDGKTHVAHGFRATARSNLAEMGWKIPAIERQLAHTEKNEVAQAYCAG